MLYNNQRVDYTTNRIENRYSNLIEKYKQRYEDHSRKTLKKKDDNKVIKYDGYFVLSNEVPEASKNINTRKNMFKKVNRKIKRDENEFLNKYNFESINEKKGNNKIKLVLPCKNEKVIPKKPKYYPLMEPPNVSICNQIYVTSNLLSNNKNSSMEENQKKLKSNNKLYQINGYSKNNIMISSNESELNDVLDEEEYLEKKKINNILYIVKKPNIGLMSENKLYNEIIDTEVINNTPSTKVDEKGKEKKNKKSSVIIESVEATLNPHSKKENECDADFYLIPYDSLKTTIKYCQTINKDVKKLTTKNYVDKTATIYKDYYLEKQPKSTSELKTNTRYDDDDLEYIRLMKKHKIPIKHINSLTATLFSSEFPNKNINKEQQEKPKKITNLEKSHLNQAYYYNSIRDNTMEYLNKDYDINPIPLGNSKFHTLLQKNGLGNEPLMINGHNPKTKSLSEVEINKNKENGLSYEEKRLIPYHSYSSYSSLLSSYPSFTLEQEIKYRKRLKQHHVKKAIVKKIQKKKLEGDIKPFEIVHFSLFSLPDDPYITTETFVVELENNYVEFLYDEPPNPFKSLHIPYIKIPEKKKKRNFYNVPDIDKAYLLDIYNFVCPPIEIEKVYEEFPEPRYAKKVFIKGKRRRKRRKNNRSLSKSTKSLSTKPISFNDKVKVNEIKKSTENQSENSILKTNTSSSEKSDVSEGSSEVEEEEEEENEDKNYDGIKEEIVPIKYIIKSTDDIEKYDSRSKLSSSTSYYSSGSNKDYSKKNSSASLNFVKIPTETIYTSDNLSKKSLQRLPTDTHLTSYKVPLSLSFNNLLKYDFLRRKRDEIKRLECLRNNTTIDKNEKNERLNILIHHNSKH